MKEKMRNKTKRKGIILVGGSGSRLYPLTQVMTMLPTGYQGLVYHEKSIA